MPDKVKAENDQTKAAGACPICGKPAGSGKFCNNSGAGMEMKSCHNCSFKIHRQSASAIIATAT